MITFKTVVRVNVVCFLILHSWIVLLLHSLPKINFVLGIRVFMGVSNW